MRVAGVLAVLITASAPAAADPVTRESAIHFLADAHAHAIVCQNSRYVVDKSVVVDLVLATDMVPTEIDRATNKIKELALELNDLDQDIVCRDAVERYGENGIWVKNLLVEESLPDPNP